ncbi:tetratricopeptide repeat protein [Bradyrhizobium sp. WSM3983]|uniref:tetratricopeptide repeat protein n=1 Tax=Bradyrhizobium sp. WSM3983 TaxID=1038867 RepID=UPI0009FCFEE5|nr:tetratricopeptide repeat protein [Bradyrhizobium sp. WSM3983]
MDGINSSGTSFAAPLHALRPPSGLTLVALFAILMVGGCASSDHPALSVQETARPELLGAKDIDPALRERIAHALGQNADEQPLREALKQQPDNVDAAISLTQVLLAQKRSDEATEVVEKLLLAAPGNLRALNAKGVVLDTEGRHREAQAIYRQALATDPANHILRNNFDLSLAIGAQSDAGTPRPQSLSYQPRDSARLP